MSWDSAGVSSSRMLRLRGWFESDGESMLCMDPHVAHGGHALAFMARSGTCALLSSPNTAERNVQTSTRVVLTTRVARDDQTFPDTDSDRDETTR